MQFFLLKVSCGADKSIIFRDISLDNKGQPEFQRVNHIVGKTTLYDMEIDVSNHLCSINFRKGVIHPRMLARKINPLCFCFLNLFILNLKRDDQYILTACQDRNIRVYAVETGKHSKTFKGSQSDDGTLIKVIIP